MFGFKKKTDKEIKDEINRESTKFKKEKHTEQLQSQLTAIKTAEKHLKHDRFQRKYGGLIKGLRVAGQETAKGLKYIKKVSKKTKRKKTKTTYRQKRSRRKSTGFTL